MVPRRNDFEQPFLTSDHRGNLCEFIRAVEELEEQRQDGDRDSQDLLALPMFEEHAPVEVTTDFAENEVQIDEQIQPSRTSLYVLEDRDELEDHLILVGQYEKTLPA